MAFERYLDDATIGALNKAHSDGEPWWCNLLHDPDVFLAVRRNVLNAYYRGCSLVEIMLDGDILKTRTHYKYLLKPNIVDAYVTGSNGKVEVSNPANAFTSDLSDLASLKRAARPFAGGEKSFVADVISSSDNTFDVEIALRREAASEGSQAAADRIDIAALSTRGSDVQVTFYEAKLFDNKELRASSSAEDATPPVIKQVDGYRRLLTSFSDEIASAYQQAAADLLRLNGLAEARRRWARSVAGADKLIIDTTPRLLIGEFDADQKSGPVWTAHLAKLKEELKHDDRTNKIVRARGSGKGLSLDAGAGPLS